MSPNDRNKTKVVDPLREFLEAVTTRLEALESHCGISNNAASSSSSAQALSGSSSQGLQKTPSSRYIAGSGTFDIWLNNQMRGLMLMFLFGPLHTVLLILIAFLIVVVVPLIHYPPFKINNSNNRYEQLHKNSDRIPGYKGIR
jgi:xanthine dehydrogenase iron-sulfur cluster and FAD-binding subunit A